MARDVVRTNPVTTAIAPRLQRHERRTFERKLTEFVAAALDVACSARNGAAGQAMQRFHDVAAGDEGVADLEARLASFLVPNWPSLHQMVLRAAVARDV